MDRVRNKLSSLHASDQKKNYADSIRITCLFYGSDSYVSVTEHQHLTDLIEAMQPDLEHNLLASSR